MHYSFACLPALKRRAFSLIEVVLALGVLGICGVLILGLLSSLMNNSRESWMETRAAQIARQILSDLRPDAAVRDSGVTTRPNSTSGMLLLDSGAVQVPILPAAPQTYSAFYSSEGAAASQGDSLFKADITIQPTIIEPAFGTLSPDRKISRIKIEIRPVNQPSGEPFTFVSFLAPL